MAARASAKADFAALLVSFASAPSMTGSAASSWLLNTDCAAAMRLAGSGDSRVRLPRAASTVRRRRLLRRTAAAPAGRLATAAPVAASTILPSAPVTKTFLDSGSADSRPSWSALMIGKASGLPDDRDQADRFVGVGEFVIGEFGDRVLERTGQRRHGEGCDQEDGKNKRAKTVKDIGRHFTTPAEVKGRRRHRRLPVFFFLLEVSCRSDRIMILRIRSGS